MIHLQDALAVLVQVSVEHPFWSAVAISTLAAIGVARGAPRQSR